MLFPFSVSEQNALATEYAGIVIDCKMYLDEYRIPAVNFIISIKYQSISHDWTINILNPK